MKKIKFMFQLLSIVGAFFAVDGCSKGNSAGKTSYRCCKNNYCVNVLDTGALKTGNTFATYIKYLRQNGYTCN